MMKDKKIDSFSIPNNNDKCLEISVFAKLMESADTKCQKLNNNVNKTTKEHFTTDM